MPVFTQIFKDFEIFPNYYRGFTFSWGIEETFEGPRPWSFVIQQSTDNGETWEDLNEPIENVMVYNDGMRRRYTKDNHLVFRCKLIDANEDVYYSFSLAPYAQLDLGTVNPKREYLIAREIMRKESLMFKVSSGVPIEIWRKDPFKRLNLTETDPYTGAILNPDTEISIMYYGPYYTEASFTPARRNKEQAPDGTGVVEPYRFDVRLLGFPYVNDGDVIVDRVQDRRYYIDAVVNVAEIRRFPIVQQVVALEAPKSDKIYRLEDI